MAILTPFRGILYNRRKIEDPSPVMTPPYDVITKEEQERYYQLHSYNIIRLVLGKGFPGDSDRENKYTRAAHYLETWQREDILIRDALPSIYYHHQEFTLKGKERRTRKGFIALVRIEDFESGVVLPHEKTMTGPKADRLKLMESCRANLSQIFSLYSDPEKKIERATEGMRSSPPYFDFFDDAGARHYLWKLHDKDIIHKIVKEMRNQSLFIADGHHRYETALTYRSQMHKKNGNINGNEAYNYVMMYLSNMNDDGLVILPTHRLLYNLKDFIPVRFNKAAERFFHIDEYRFDSNNELAVRNKLIAQLERQGQGDHTFGIYTKGECSYNLFTLKSEYLLNSGVMEGIPHVIRSLDVSILQAFILKSILGIDDQNMASQNNVDFIEDAAEAIELVKNDKYQLACLMNPTRMEQVNEAASAGVQIPQKSTFFYPKFPGGMVINSIHATVNA